MGRQNERSDRQASRSPQQTHERRTQEQQTQEQQTREQGVAAPGAGLLAMQRSHGNQQVQQLLTAAKGRTGDPGDRWEREADQVARLAAARPGPIADATGGVLGADLSDVRMHTGADAAQLTSAFDAHAFTTGRNVYFGEGEYQPGNRDGRELIAHELAHVVQQGAGDQGRGHDADAGAGQGAAPVQLKKRKKNDWVTDRVDRLKGSIGGKTAKACRVKLAKRLKDGPPLTSADLMTISDLTAATAYQAGADWLEEAGLDLAWANGYLADGDFSSWVLLDPVQRVLAASIAWDLGIGKGAENPSPAYTLGRHMAIQKGLGGQALQDAKDERNETIRNAFINTLNPDPANVPAGSTQVERDNVDQAAAILRKLLIMLHAGAQIYSKSVKAHENYTEDIARLLAHGGRVNIRIPALRQGEGAYDLTDWLGITDQGQRTGGVYARDFGTHSVDINRNTYHKNGTIKKYGKFQEGDGAIAANTTNTLDNDVRIWGMDLAAGGYGKLDFNGDVIRPNGGHGHMFIGFTKPGLKKDGALQIGLETTAPGKDEFSPVGKDHGMFSNESNANPESSFYGHKSAKVGNGPLQKVGRLLNLNKVENDTGMQWMDKLDALEAAWLAAPAAAGGPDYEKLVGPKGTF